MVWPFVCLCEVRHKLTFVLGHVVKQKGFTKRVVYVRGIMITIKINITTSTVYGSFLIILEIFNLSVEKGCFCNTYHATGSFLYELLLVFIGNQYSQIFRPKVGSLRLADIMASHFNRKLFHLIPLAIGSPARVANPAESVMYNVSKYFLSQNTF